MEFPWPIFAKIELICQQPQVSGAHPSSGVPERMTGGWWSGLAMCSGYICFRDLHASWSDPLLLLFDFFEDKMNRGDSSWNISVCFDYNIQVLWLTSNRCWADVCGRHQPNVEATLGRHRTADIDPTSAQHMFPCSFFSLIISQHNLPELLCTEIVPMLEAAINSGPVLAWLQTYCTLTWKLDSY